MAFKRILVPVDGSPASRKAGKRAIAFAKAVGASIVSYYAMPLVSPVLFGEGYAIPQKAMDEIDAAQRRTGERYVEDLAKKAEKAGVKCERLLTRAIPAEGIAAAAQSHKCDVIFLGAHGWDAMKGLVLGSVTQRVLHQSKVPVLVYR